MARMQTLLGAALGLLPTLAHAGSGPWVVGAGSSSWFGAVEAQRLTQLSIVTDAQGSTQEVDVGEGLSTLGVKGIASYGILPRVELEVEIPWYRAYANRDDADLCGALGLDACRTTQGIGILRAQVKALVLDELGGAPLSASVALTSRYGAFTAPERARITNLGEGTFDLGPTVAAGRTGGLGGSGGFWSAYGEAGWRYRFANTDAFPSAELPVPGSEYHGTMGVLLSPGAGSIGAGPLATGLWRPGGLDWYELSDAGGLSDIDRFSALRVSSVRVGAEALIRGRDGMSLSMSALRTVAARNNPSDAFVFSVGLSAYRSPSQG